MQTVITLCIAIAPWVLVLAFEKLLPKDEFPGTPTPASKQGAEILPTPVERDFPNLKNHKTNDLQTNSHPRCVCIRTSCFYREMSSSFTI
jgi:hypothetical protein